MDSSLILTRKNYNKGFVNSGIDKNNIPSASSITRRGFLNIMENQAEDLFAYLNIVGLPADSNIIVLAPGQHYYYDESDLRNVRTLINLKKLNQIKDINKYLHNLYRILPENANYIGCFHDCTSHRGKHSKTARHSKTLINRLANFLKGSYEQDMTRQKVTELLWKHNFEIVDMTEINGLTYFYSRNIEKPFELRA
ncbi:MAG: hypothetical protein HPY62_09675 [Bacteroidales bacterium]|nr:hypothetical protein [Bacteroidales bacterium]